MPRWARITVPGVSLHLIQRGNNRQACFFRETDYRLYLEWLAEYSSEASCAVHAYVLMTNHVHLLLTPQTASSASELMKQLGQRYAQYINRTQRRSGTLWEGRFRSCLIESETYVLACHRYIELNPVRAQMVEHPAMYVWSSYRANGQGEPSSLLTPHPLYQELGRDEASRLCAYGALFENCDEQTMTQEIRAATKGNYVLGCRAFEEALATSLGRRVTPGRSGRPRKT